MDDGDGSKGGTFDCGSKREGVKNQFINNLKFFESFTH